ncbi:gliding motility-associated C-terminal domain-containing protein [Flavobacterium sp. JP2137]|uniref:gliding motility-associated C-terminal domain-containing protein n=1 Tax=Flavobacterium sp. JP2137 TaxID=3414510 RepID=UPI003D2FB1EA
MKKLLLIALISCFSHFALGQVINPNDVIGVCSAQNIVSPTPTGTIYNNLRTHCSTSNLTNTLVLYYIEITAGTTFTFVVTPTANVDYDFGSWLNPNLNNLGPADRGSQNDPNITGMYSIGLSLMEPTETCELPGAGISGLIPGMVRHYDVVPGDAILIAVNRWSVSDSGFVISFGGNATLNCSLFDKDFRKCDEDHDGEEIFDLSQIATDIRNGITTDIIDFFALENDAKNPAATNVLPLTYVATTANNPNTIYARIKRGNGVMKKVMKIELYADKVPDIQNQNIDFEMCDYNNDGTEIFNLKSLEREIANGQTDLQFKYYEDITDANDNTTNTIQSPQTYSASDKTIYIRVSILDRCPVIVTVNLRVNPTAVLPITSFDYELCETNHQGTAIFNLSSQESLISAGQTDLSFKYYENNADALLDNNNYIANPTTYTSDSKTLYVRVSLKGKCPITVTLNLVVFKAPKIENKKIDYAICDDDLDGKETFDLTSYETVIAQGQTDLEFSYYEVYSDAEMGNLSTITATTAYTSKKKTVYIRVTIDNHCPVIIHLNLIPAKTKMSPSETLISEFCGEVTSNALIYDLTRALPALLQGEPAQDYQISYHEEESDARNSKNNLTDFKNYSVLFNELRIIYVRMENKMGCFAVSSIKLDSKDRITNTDQYMKACDPYELPALSAGYAYYTQPNGPNGKGTKIEFSQAGKALVFGKRTIYIYGSSKAAENLADNNQNDAEECIYETSFTVYNNECKVPKGISPNGDGKNDFWDLTPFGVSRLSIINRYGKEVYTFSGTYTNQWMGQSNSGHPLPDGTYWYSMDALNGELEGWIQIIR